VSDNTDFLPSLLASPRSVRGDKKRDHGKKASLAIETKTF